MLRVAGAGRARAFLGQPQRRPQFAPACYHPVKRVCARVRGCARALIPFHDSLFDIDAAEGRHAHRVGEHCLHVTDDRRYLQGLLLA